jgi:hypothetical protein
MIFVRPMPIGDIHEKFLRSERVPTPVSFKAPERVTCNRFGRKINDNRIFTSIESRNVYFLDER